MWTARDVSLRLRRELDDERLGVKLDLHQGRWMVYVRRKMLTGARRWPVIVRDDGTVQEGGATTIRVVDFLDDIVWVVEVDGEYHPLEPNLIRQKLIERDTHRRDVAKELFQELARRKQARRQAFLDDAKQRALHYRRAFARVAEDMGLGGRPDYSRIYRPRPFVAEV
jgi:hypothetical protein